MTKNKIWCLFSIDCNYDQPDNNLVAWWQEKPSIEQLAKYLATPLGKDNASTVAIVDVWTGKRAQLTSGGAEYRLEEVMEAQALKPNEY